MSKQSSSSDDGSLNIAFFSVLTVSLFLLFIFSEGEALPEEGGREMAVLSSLESELQEDLKADNVALYNENTFLAQSAPSYHDAQLLAVKEENKKEEKEESKKEEKEESKKEEKEEEVAKEMWVALTAYAPLDPGAIEGMCYSGNPAITASGTNVREGVVATNLFDFGTRIRIPSLFGDRIFVVEDRMSSRFTNTVDIFVHSRQEASSFGRKGATIEVLK